MIHKGRTLLLVILCLALCPVVLFAGEQGGGFPFGKKEGKIIEPNLTAVFVLLSFLFLMIALNRILIRPVLRIMDERREKVDVDKEEARRNRQKSAELKKQYDEAILAVRVEAHDKLVKLESESRRDGAETIQRKKKEIDLFLREEKKKVAGELEAEMVLLDREVGAFARRFVQKVLQAGVEVRSDVKKRKDG